MADADICQKLSLETNEEAIEAFRFRTEIIIKNKESAQMKHRNTYNIAFHPTDRSKSYSINRSKSVTSFSTVNEEKNEEDDSEIQKLRKLEFLIQSEGYDKTERGLDSKPRYTRSNKAISLMDIVEEVKEDKDNDITHPQSSFQKKKIVHDYKDELSIQQNTNSHFHNSKHELEQNTIVEDNNENEVEVQPIHFKGSNKSLPKIEDFIDNTDRIDEHHQHGNIIKEEIKEVEEIEDKQIEEEIIEKSCKLLTYFIYSEASRASV